MIYEKLRQDFLDIFPNEASIRNSYMKYLQTNSFNEISSNRFTYYKKRSSFNNQIIKKLNFIPEKNILSKKYYTN